MRKPVLAILSAVLLAAISLPALPAQQPQPSKEQKKPRKVWTEEDLKGLSGNINVVGTEAPPEAPARPAPAGAAASADFGLWAELDDLTEQRRVAQEQIELNRGHVEAINREIAEETNPVALEELLQGREWQEEQARQYEDELEQVNARIAELERLLAGRKRPPQPKAVRPEKVRPAPEAEAGEAQEEPEAPPVPAEEEPAEEEPPPPPPSL